MPTTAKSYNKYGRGKGKMSDSGYYSGGGKKKGKKKKKMKSYSKRYGM